MNIAVIVVLLARILREVTVALVILDSKEMENNAMVTITYTMFRPGAYIFQRTVLRGLYSERGYIRRRLL